MFDVPIVSPETILMWRRSVPAKVKRLVVLLVKPSRYDEQGYLLRFHRGALPSNSLAALYSLSEAAFQTGVLAGLQCEVHAFDEVTWRYRVSPKSLVAKYLDGNTTVVVGLVAVQTNQFPRSRDLAYAFKRAGATVVMGGFHVSGSISTMLDGISSNDPKRPDVPCPHIMPPEIEELTRDGIIVFHGESEHAWQQVLADIVGGAPQTLYRGGMPDLTKAPVPQYPPGYFAHFAGRVDTLDTGRGCPFGCSFCAIINVQGRSARWRNSEAVVAKIKELCETGGRVTFFLTDDNFARNPCWEEILDGFIELRKQGCQFTFMVEIDLASHKIPGFIKKLGQAGCGQAFIGMESVNQETLRKANKPQNRVESYQRFCDQLHAQGIIVHVGYIIGFEDDTSEGILRDVATIKAIGVDLASFFILTPLPGSEDHIRMLVARVPMDEDLNWYDTSRPVTDHPHMSREQLQAIYQRCWVEFYRSRHMIEALRRCPKKLYWWLFKTLLWCRNSALGEKTHPMMCGFWRIRSRLHDRRPGYAVEGVVGHTRKELWRYLRYVGHLLREFYVFQHVYFQSQLKPGLVGKLSGNLRGARDWFSRTFRMPATRTWLNTFWIRYAQQKWNLFWRWDWHIRMVPYAITEIAFTVRFWWTLIRNARVLIQG